MKLVNKILYIEFSDFIAAGWTVDGVKKANYRNGAYWQMIPNPDDQRAVLVRFDTLRQKDQQKIELRFGNPYEYLSTEPIKQLVTTDFAACRFYSAHRYHGNKSLEPEYVDKYTAAASWLNMLIRVTADNSTKKQVIKQELNLTVEKFYSSVSSIIQALDLPLPITYDKITRKIKQYQTEGYACIIDGRFGNRNAIKLGKTEEGYCEEREQQQLAIIRKVARLPMNFDNQQIALVANRIFEKNNWTQVSRETVALRVKENMPNIIAGKRGDKVFNNEVAMQVKRVAPEFPSYYWTLDGWTVELLYQDEKSFNNRLVMVVVLDACNKYPVGYAIGERENTELIRMALRNAIIHMQDLFGATYRPWQLQSDRYGLKNLTSFYGAISHLYTPAAVGNAKAKIVEPYFKHLNKKHCQAHFNWSGFNINSSKVNQPNIERLDQIKRTLPSKAGVIDQINRFMLKERLAKVDDYRSRWERMPQEDQVTLSPTQCLEVFGKTHNELNTITGLGLKVTLDGQKLVYDSFDPAFRALQFSSKFKVLYDSCDFSQVLAITEDGKQKFILHNKLEVGMGFKNTTPEQLEYRQRITDFNKQRKEDIIQIYMSDDALVEDIIANTPLNLSNDEEAALKLMFTTDGQQKERLQDAKGLRKIQQQIAKTEKREEVKQAAIETRNHNDQHQEYLRTKTDINQYLD